MQATRDREGEREKEKATDRDGDRQRQTDRQTDRERGGGDERDHNHYLPAALRSE